MDSYDDMIQSLGKTYILNNRESWKYVHNLIFYATEF